MSTSVQRTKDWVTKKGMSQKIYSNNIQPVTGRKKKAVIYLCVGSLLSESHINMVNNGLIRPYIFNCGLFIKVELQKSPCVIFMNCDFLIIILQQYHWWQNDRIKFMTQPYKSSRHSPGVKLGADGLSFSDQVHNYKYHLQSKL